MDRVLRWYIDGNISRVKTEVGGTYILDGNYVAEWVHLTARVAGRGDEPTIVDINDDGVSILTYNPALMNNQTAHLWTTVSPATLRENSVITCDIDQVSSEDTCRDLTVELGLRKV